MPVGSVTGNRNGRAHLVAGRRSPRSHVLTKAVGNTISGNWDVRNTGSVSGNAFLSLRNASGAVLNSGPTTSVPGGSTASLVFNWLVTAALATGPNTLTLSMFQIDPITGANVEIASHVFTVTRPSDQAILSPIGEPTII